MDKYRYYAKRLRNRRPKWQTLEEALSLWTSTVIENGYALTGDAILAKSYDYWLEPPSRGTFELKVPNL